MMILASESRIRAEMLRNAGLVIETAAAQVDERGLDQAARDAGAGPDRIAQALAEAKALAVSVRHPGHPVIGADQTLALGGERFSKAQSLDQAREHLTRMRGRTHQLHSGYALARDGLVLDSGVESATLTMRTFSEAFLDRYLPACGPTILDSVGCYQIEGRGVSLFERIEGDHFTILGLPLLAVLAALRRHGYVEA